jgi:hypothetical protein
VIETVGRPPAPPPDRPTRDRRDRQLYRTYVRILLNPKVVRNAVPCVPDVIIIWRCLSLSEFPA